jgi:hypothetical protein
MDAYRRGSVFDRDVVNLLRNGESEYATWKH